MHVVGDDGATVGRERAGNREIVAAGRFRVGSRSAGGVAGQCAQIDQLRAGQHGIAARCALQRRIPTAAVVGQQREQRWRQVRTHPPQRQFTRILATLQVEIHCHADQGRVLGAPGLR